MVAEDGDHRHLERSAGFGQDGGLLGKTVRRQVSREENDVRVRLDGGEDAAKPVAERLRGVDVPGCCDANRRAHRRVLPAIEVRGTAVSGIPVTVMPSAAPENLESLLTTMKRAAAALRESQVEFMLGGGLAIWARGGPPTDHDVDLFLRERDADKALDALRAAGMRTEKPPEHWLYKAWDGANLVDLVFRPAGGPIDDEHFARADEIEVNAQRLAVASIDDVLVTKLLALSEQEPDYRDVLVVARSLREQVSWADVAARTGDSPFARAFFTLVTGLGVVPAAEAAAGAPSVATPAGRRSDDVVPGAVARSA